MFNFTLYRHELSGTWKSLAVFAAILTMYVPLTITMFNPASLATLDGYVDLMPEVMAAFGMKKGIATLSGFLASYLYDFILIMFPAIFIMLLGNRLIAKYVDSGSMVSLLAAPVKRTTLAFTQMKVFSTAILMLVLYIFVMELVICYSQYPDLTSIKDLLLLNIGLFALLLFVGGICFLSSCVFSDTKRSMAFGAGIPTIMFLLKMLSNNGGNLEKLKYFTFLTLFNPEGIIAGKASAIAAIFVFFAGAVALFSLGILVFKRKDLCI